LSTLVSGAEKARERMCSMRKSKKNILPRIVVLIFVVYVSVTLIQLQIDINAKKQQIDELSSQIQQQKKTNAELQSSLDADVDKEYIAKIAREKLGYGEPNEQFYVDIAGS